MPMAGSREHPDSCGAGSAIMQITTVAGGIPTTTI